MSSSNNLSSSLANGSLSENPHALLSIENMKLEIEKLKIELCSDIEDKIVSVCDKLTDDLDITSGISSSSTHNAKTESSQLPIKTFHARHSLLSDMFQMNHFRAIYNIFVAIFLLFVINAFIHDLIERGSISVNFELITWAFGSYATVLITWLTMMFITLLVYPLFLGWSSYRNPTHISAWDFLWLSIFVLLELYFIYFPVHVILSENLPPASTMIVVAEQLRLLMKIHAFVRENIPKVLYLKEKNEDELVPHPLPGFGAYLYFLFCPTLVYRDQYPRNKSINWGFVMSNLAQVVACMFFLYYLFERFCVPVFRNFNQRSVTPKALALAVFGSMFPGTMVLLMAFFGVLHSWLNAFAEMLRFADRQFYMDWWNSTNFASYYRTWNVVVHDWLYSYIYRDSMNLLGLRKHNRAISMAVVFFVSAIVHEYVIILTLRFFYPVLFVLFAGCGFIMQFIKGRSRAWNVFMWMGLIIGTGLCMCLYSMEWFARKRCPASDSIFDYVIPRSWDCDFEHLKT